MLSMKDSVELSSSSCTVAVYKGLSVIVYNVNKSEINLTRQDLIELVNVCSVLLCLYIQRGPKKDHPVLLTS